MKTTKALRNGLLLFPFLLLPQAGQDPWKDAVLTLIGRDFDQAISKMEAAIRAVPPSKGREAKVDRRRYLRANALLAAGRFGQAKEAFQKLAEDRPDGRYAALARFGVGAALERVRILKKLLGCTRGK